MNIRKLILEEVSAFLSEIGDSMSSPYPFRQTKNLNSRLGHIKSFEFETQYGLNYLVEIIYSPDNSEFIDVDFRTKEGGYEPINAYDDMFKIMATIVKILDQEKKKTGFNGIKFSSSKTRGGGEDIKSKEQRDRLYLQYIKSKYPNAQIVDKSRDSMKILLNPTQSNF